MVIKGGKSLKYILDMHCHTVASGHAYSTVEEIVRGAKKNHVQVVGIADHAPKMPGSCHLFHFQNLKVIPREIEGVKLFFGVETNIMDYDGKIDMHEETLEMLDYAIASLHPPCIKPGSIRENTNALLQAINNKYVNIIGHPDDSRYPVDYEEVVKAARDNNVLLEINNSSLNPKGFRQDAKENIIKMLELCDKHRASIILSSDAHISLHVGIFNFCDTVIKETNFPKELIVNDSIDKLINFINIPNEINM